MVEDLALYETELRERYPAPLPVFLVGHSMGGLISLRYVTTQKTDVVGLVLTGTAAAKPTDISGLTVAIGNLLAKVTPMSASRHYTSTRSARIRRLWRRTRTIHW